MPRFVSLFIDRAHQRFLGFALWSAMLLIVLVAGVALVGQLVNQSMNAEAQRILAPLSRLQDNILSTSAEMKRRLTAEPCSPAFHAQLRDIAFLPDGLNEFVYAPGGVVRCSVDADFAPYDLGPPDLLNAGTGLSMWYDRSLGFLGRGTLVGTIVAFDGLGMVVPLQTPPDTPSSWMRSERVNVSANGDILHRDGQQGTYFSGQQVGPLGAYLPLRHGSYFTTACVKDGLLCVGVAAPLTAFIAGNGYAIAVGIMLGAILALGISTQLHALLRHFWSFEARFRRHFNQKSIICTYQPILTLATGKISGCEVLVRWRDVDGATIYPDQFLPIVEQHGLGRQLTEYVVARAYEELSNQVPVQYRLQVNFNIFPRDLDAAWLRDTLRVFEASQDRFDTVVEIVETDAMQIEHAQHEIDILRRGGIKTHLDDFGTGYSNIENLARLPVDGVKLDRSFAMAPDGSMMARMLANAIEMIHAAGHRITVEGVETEERLQTLKQTGQVDCIQGYLISRPLDIRRFVQFLVEHSTPIPLRPHLVA